MYLYLCPHFCAYMLHINEHKYHLKYAQCGGFVLRNDLLRGCNSPRFLTVISTYVSLTFLCYNANKCDVPLPVQNHEWIEYECCLTWHGIARSWQDLWASGNWTLSGRGQCRAELQSRAIQLVSPFLLAAPCNTNICSKYIEQCRSVCLNTTYFFRRITHEHGFLCTAIDWGWIDINRLHVAGCNHVSVAKVIPEQQDIFGAGPNRKTYSSKSEQGFIENQN